MTAKTTTAIGYVRVSTEEQAAEGVSLDAQRAKIRAYCDLNGLELDDVFSDEGISGKRADNRPGLQRALKAVCQAKGVLVVYSLSRLARSTLDCIHIVTDLERCQADLASISEKLDTTSAMGKFFFRLMASLGELERDQVSERTKTVLSHKRRLGHRISGRIPYGYDLAADGVTLVPNAAEQKVVEFIAGQRAAGHSYRKIAETLNDQGVAPKVGSLWYAMTVRGIAGRQKVMGGQGRS